MTDREMADELRKRGWGVVPPDQYLIDIEPAFREMWERVEPFTMTYLERGYALFKAIEYLTRNRINGDIVECGVWRGGSCMLMALSLAYFGSQDRTVRLYDTFEGMTEPTEEDVIAWNDRSVLERWEEDKKGVRSNFASWAVGINEVRANMRTTGYPTELIKYIPGDICETLREHGATNIALLRLDTDWYKSTAYELEILYPKVVPGGILVVDDYGHFKGARKAVDEYFSKSETFPLFNRADYTGRIMVKPNNSAKTDA